MRVNVIDVRSDEVNDMQHRIADEIQSFSNKYRRIPEIVIMTEIQWCYLWKECKESGFPSDVEMKLETVFGLKIGILENE